MFAASLRNSPIRRCAVNALAASVCLAAYPSCAQQYLTFPATISSAMPDALAAATKYSAAPASPFIIADPLYRGVQAGLWTIYPLVQSSVRYDDNILGTHLKPVADGYLDVAPSIVASRSNGIHTTVLYGALDSNTYFNVAKADHTNLRAGFQQIWEARRDLVFSATGDIARSSDLSSTGSPIAQGGFLPVSATTVRGSLSMLKSAHEFFFKTSLVGSRTAYSAANTENGITFDQGYRDFNEYLLIQRAGFSPRANVNVFEETTFSKQDLYRSPSSSSTGVRQIFGAGAQQWRNFSGELFMGVQERTYNSSAVGVVWQPVWGGTLSWRPREYLQFNLSQDQIIQTGNTISPFTPQITAMRATDTTFSGFYSRAREWRAGFTVKYEDATYVNYPERDKTLVVGLEFAYLLNRNFILNCGFQRIYVWSNVEANTYVKDVSSAGFSYRY